MVQKELPTELQLILKRWMFPQIPNVYDSKNTINKVKLCNFEKNDYLCHLKDLYL